MNLLTTTMLKLTLLFFSVVLVNVNATAFTPSVTDTVLHATDTTGPVVSISVQFKRITLKTYSSNADKTSPAVFPKNSELSITGNDATTGLKEIYVTLDNTTEVLYRIPLRLTARGRHTVRARAVDNAGNETNFVLDFIIEE